VAEDYVGAHRKPEEQDATDAGPDTQPSPQAHPSEPIATLPELEPETIEAPSEPIPAPAQPVVVPAVYHYLKRWTFVLVLIAVCIPAAAGGLALYYWWYHSLDKTLAVFIVMVYVIVCTVGGLLTAMVEHKPLLSAVAIALLSALFWSVAAAAVLHGVYFCQHASRCLVGVIPY
jgi:hypothetical protein